MADSLALMNSELLVNNWLVEVGFHFDPFVCLDAGADPHINAYLVSHQALAAMWGDWPAMAFAPAGGGKTALRVQVMRACWAGPDIGHPFPIPYIPLLGPLGELPSTLAEHLTVLLQAAALRLLMALFLHPHWWETLDGPVRRLMRGLLERDLPLSLAHFLAQLEDAQALISLYRSIDVTSAPNTEPDPARWLPLCAELRTTPAGPTPESLEVRLQIWLDLLLGPFNFDSVYLLLDGIDGFVETATDTQAAIALLQPLLDEIPDWAGRRLFLKGFFPIEMADALSLASSHLTQPVRQVTLRWSPPLLAEVIRQRVYVATEGTYGSLDALSTPGLRDTETQLARIVAPLPREILVLTGRLLWEHARRAGDDVRLTPDDFQAAAMWYESQREQVAQPALAIA